MANYTMSIVFKGVDELSGTTAKISSTMTGLVSVLDSVNKSLSQMEKMLKGGSKGLVDMSQKQGVANERLNAYKEHLVKVRQETATHREEVKKKREEDRRAREAIKAKKAAEQALMDVEKKRIANLAMLRGATKQTFQGMQSFGRKGIMSVSLPLIALGTAAVVTSGKFAALRSAFSGLAKKDGPNAGSKLFDALIDMSDKTTFTIDQTADSAQKLLAVDIASSEIPEVLGKIGDIATGAGKPIGQLAGIYGRIATKGKATGRELLRLDNIGAGMRGAIAKVLEVPTETLDDSIRAGKVTFSVFKEAIDNMTGENGKFFNMQKRQMDTLPGIWSATKDKISNTLAILGDDIEKTFDIKGKLKAFGQWVVDLRGEWKALSKDQKESRLQMLAIAAATPFVIKGMGDIGMAIFGLTAFVGNGIKIMQALSFSISGLTLSATAGFFALVPFVTMVTALGLAGYELIKNWEHVKGFFTDIWDEPMMTLKTYLRWLDYMNFGLLGTSKIAEAIEVEESTQHLSPKTREFLQARGQITEEGQLLSKAEAKQLGVYIEVNQNGQVENFIAKELESKPPEFSGNDFSNFGLVL